ncbi:MAG: serine/threonine protein kinase/formylglycine-generating enzyme required for sulfatase activity [Planctomycetota bacterium]|jgi:serine/threonine protein kinase/formylglycine-generating enzyme required for sulfatase activity
MAEDKQVQAFIEQYCADLAANKARELADYQELYPGADDAIAAAFATLMDASTVMATSSTASTARTVAGEVDRPKNPVLGKSLGHYSLLNEIGRGGQGLVLLAKDERLGRLVALKVLNGGAMQTSDSLLRFKREAEAVSRLDDPGICTVYETGTIEDVPYIAMQYIEGKSLAAILRDEKAEHAPIQGEISTLSAKSRGSQGSARSRIDRYIALIEQVARSLETAHESGLIHRDIKPGNIMTGKDGRPIILDFGLAHDEDADGQGLTRTGDVLGTPAYMAPEQIRGDLQTIDRRTDIYALGVTLFECVTLERPFVAATRQALYRQISEGRTPRASAIVPGIRRDLEVILKTAMDTDLDRRYQSAGAFADDLARLIRREPILARPASWGLKLSRWGERNPALATSLAIMFVLLSVGLIVTTSLWRQSDADRALAESEKTRAEEKTREARTNLAGYEMLSDGNRFRQYRDDMVGFYPPHPDRIPEIDGWFKKIEELVAREPLYKAELKALENHSRAIGIGEIEATYHDANVSTLIQLKARRSDLRIALGGKLADKTRQAYSKTLVSFDSTIQGIEQKVLQEAQHVFDDSDQDWRHTNLERLIRYISVLKDETTPLSPVASMILLRQQCEQVESESLINGAEVWRQAIEHIADKALSPFYDGLKIEPQLGLLPIGQDPVSGLWEFANVLTGKIPVRDASGKLILESDFAAVFVLLPGGTHMIGARAPQVPGETGPHIDPYSNGSELEPRQVTFDPFFIGKYEFTMAQWAKGTGDDVRQIPGEDGVTEETFLRDGKLPLSYSSWDVANEFIVKLELQLPTEAQWEYACRGLTTTPWWVGETPDTLINKANFEEQDSGETRWADGFQGITFVDAFAPNAFGLYNFMGNVWEFTRDGRKVDVEVFLPGDGSHTAVTPDQFVIRGGSCQTSPFRGKSAMRASIEKQSSSSTLGIRAARKLKGKWGRP